MARARTRRTKHSAANLLAIAVDPSAQSRGIGRLLVASLEHTLLEWDVRGGYCVATNVAETGSNAFYRSLGFQPTTTIRHHKLTLQLYHKALR